LSFYLSKKSLKPLDRVRREIQEITDKNLNKRLPEPVKDNELKALANSFNQMMDRIDGAYQRQKEFTGNASHELRTPIAKILAQLENVLHKTDIPDKVKDTLRSITDDASQLSEIVTSLLLLSEIDNRDGASFPLVRLDEIIFNSASRISKVNRDFKFYFEIENNGEDMIDLEIEADEILLQIAFTNLMRNAYLYSDNKSVRCVISQLDNEAQITITNSGPTPDVEDTSVLFNTFSRGNNTQDKAGSGIGLSIVKRILQYHNARVKYNIEAANINTIIVNIPMRFKKNLI
jgi:signal transduction histidine kinase